MSDRRRIVILPGLDGTGRLLVEFAEHLRSHFTVDVIAYPVDKPKTYDELMSYVQERLPRDEYILIGESFSGPLAIRLASQNFPSLKAVVLGASFARLDFPVKGLMDKLVEWAPRQLIPFAVLNFLLMGGRATEELRQGVKEVLKGVQPEVLKIRAKEALNVDLIQSQFEVEQPVLYLQALADRLIPSSAAKHIGRIAPQTVVHGIDAPHFLFQMEPLACAKAIIEFDISLSNS
ncbi:hypothetical protein [Phyllobacterium sp. SB3]|uniref:alpha/beta fold hydrolase n=1 Tax=Phyllobacterium sp. SB3 TaxID=3156073 RepID=UPI0032AFBF3E